MNHLYTRLDIPIGMVRFDELLNLLLALWMSGGADEHTLRMVAQTYGLLAAFDARQREPSLCLRLAMEVSQ